MSDYLQSELLAHLSADELRFLTRTAVLERMSGPLCDAVLEASGSAAILESLARSNLFLVPLDAHGEWYRYHHLFRELLRSELARAEPDLVPRAPRSCSRLVRGERAAGGGDRVRAGGRRRRPRGAAVRAVRPTRVPERPRRRPSSAGSTGWSAHGALERNAAVAVLGALDAAAQGRPAEAERWAEVAERASYEGTLPDGSASIDSWLALLRALRCREGWRGCARMRSLRSGRSPVGARSGRTPLLLLAISQWLAGEVDQADDLLADVVEEGLELGAAEAVAVALGERAAIAIGRGAWVQAEEFADRALRVIRRSRMGEYPTSAFAYALAARVALHRGETRARARAPRPGATPAAAAHLRAAVLRRPDPPGARPRLPDDRRRRRRRDDAARDRRAPAPTARSRHAPRPGRGAARRA